MTCPDTMRLFNHKKGNSVSTTTPSSTAIPASTKSTPMPSLGHRRTQSATPDARGTGPLKLLKPTGIFKPAPAPLPVVDPVLEREKAKLDPAQPFFAAHEDGYLNNVPAATPINIPPSDLDPQHVYGRRVVPVRNETVPSRRPQRTAQPHPTSATVSGRPDTRVKPDRSKPPLTSRPKHYNHLSDSAVHTLGSSRPRPDSPLPADVGQKPRTIRATGTLDAPKPKTD